MAMTPQEKKDRDALRKAIAEATHAGANNHDALGRVLRTTQSGEPPTAAQLRMVNATRTRLGLPRVSLPVFDREKRRAFFERRSQTINSEHATLVASRPLSPPGRFYDPNIDPYLAASAPGFDRLNPKGTPCLDPDKMHGAADQFPGSDYADYPDEERSINR